MKKTLCILTALLICAASLSAQAPDNTYEFASRDTCKLYLDFYKADSTANIKAEKKPLIIYVFGGSFMSGYRSKPSEIPWFKALNEAGYHVAAIDYRLGLKGVNTSKVNVSVAKALASAIDIAVEDLLSATSYLIDHADELGIDKDMIIASGSSAGAITSMQAEWAICNSHQLASGLPAGFNYAAVMSFAGALFSIKGGISYAKAPCPTLMFHGTADSIVPYKKISLLGMHFAGSGAIWNVFEKNGFNACIYSYPGRNHEICYTMGHNLPEELRFLEENVKKGIDRKVDASVVDPSIPTPAWILELKGKKSKQ